MSQASPLEISINVVKLLWNIVNTRNFRILWLCIGTCDPAAIRKTIYSHNKEKLKELFLRLESEKSSGGSVHAKDLDLHAAVRKYEDQFVLLARCYWGRSNPRCGAISSRYYELAAECASGRSDHLRAAVLFHWAGHQFRDNGFLDVAMDCYLHSALHFRIHAESLADLTEKTRAWNDCARSAKRAVGVCLMVGETTKAALIQTRFPLTKTYDPEHELDNSMRKLLS